MVHKTDSLMPWTFHLLDPLSNLGDCFVNVGHSPRELVVAFSSLDLCAIGWDRLSLNIMPSSWPGQGCIHWFSLFSQ